MGSWSGFYFSLNLVSNLVTNLSHLRFICTLTNPSGVSNHIRNQTSPRCWLRGTVHDLRTNHVLLIVDGPHRAVHVGLVQESPAVGSLPAGMGHRMCAGHGPAVRGQWDR